MIYNDFKDIGSIIHKHRRASYSGSHLDYLIIEMLGINRNLKDKEEILVEIFIDTVNKRVEEKISYATEDDLKKHLVIQGVVGNKPRPALSGSYNFFKTTKKVNKDTNEITYNSKFKETINNIIENRNIYNLKNIKKRVSPIIGGITISEKDLSTFFEVLDTINQPEILNQILELLSKYKEKEGSRYYFTIYIDGKSINEYEAYKYILLTYEFKKIRYRKAVCSCCGRETVVSEYFPTALPGFKLFTTTNKCFGDVKTKFENKFVLCTDCFIDIYHFIANRNIFETSMGFINKEQSNIGVLVYPKFLLGELPDYETLIGLSEKAKKSIKYLGSPYIKSIRNIEDELLDENKSFCLNILFFKQNQALTRILERIEDTPPLRLISLFKEMEKQKLKYSKNEKENFGNLMVHFNKTMIYSKISLDTRNKNLFIEDPNEFKNFPQKSYLNILNIIIRGHEIARSEVLEYLTKALNNVHFKEGNEMYSPKYRKAVKYSYAILSFLENIGCVREYDKGADIVFYKKLQKYKDQSYLCRDIIEIAEEEDIYDDESLFYVSLGILLNKVNYLQNSKGNKGILSNFNFKSLTKKGTENVLLEVLEKHMIYAPNEIANAHLLRLMLSYVDKLDDSKMTISERALKVHLGIALSSSMALERVAMKKNKRNSNPYQESEADKETNKNDEILGKSIYELFDNLLDEYEEEEEYYEDLKEEI